MQKRWMNEIVGWWFWMVILSYQTLKSYIFENMPKTKCPENRGEWLVVRGLTMCDKNESFADGWVAL